MEAREIKEGQTYYVPGILHFPVQVKVLKVLGKTIVTDKGYVYSKNIYKSKEECPQR